MLAARGLALQTLKNEGIVGMYRGMGLPLATVALFNAVLFSSRGAVNEVLKHKDGALLTARTAPAYVSASPMQFNTER
jgi:Mitochondrial carrier protein